MSRQWLYLFVLSFFFNLTHNNALASTDSIKESTHDRTCESTIHLTQKPKEISSELSAFLYPSELDFQAYPFELIKVQSFKPALQAAYELALERVDQFLMDKNTPTFENTYLKLADITLELDRVSILLSIYSSTLSNPENFQIISEANSLKNAFNEELYFKVFNNETIYKRVLKISKKKNLTPSQKRVLVRLLKIFEEAGLNLNSKKREEFKKLSLKLSDLKSKFSENLIQQNLLVNSYYEITDSKDLRGLPEDIIQRFKKNAIKLNKPHSWVIHLATEDLTKVFEYSENRDLQKELYYLSKTLNFSHGPFDNKQIAIDIIKTEQAMAQLLGKQSPAHLKLEDTMAGSPQSVVNFYQGFYSKALEKAISEKNEIQNIKNEDLGFAQPLTPWDFSYWYRKTNEKNYNFNSEQLRPYLEFNKVLNGVFSIANRLYGFKFIERRDLPVYHPDVKAYEVDRQGQSLGLLYYDPFEREGKLRGAWSHLVNPQESHGKENGYLTPIINLIVSNFQKSFDKEKTYLSIDNVRTLLHEMGHALHGFASQVEYRDLSGPNGVSFDFVEVPSKFMENYLLETSVLQSFATNDQGEPIPKDLLNNFIKAHNFGSGLSLLANIKSARLDIETYSLSSLPSDFNLSDYEKALLKDYSLFSDFNLMIEQSQITRFSHIMIGAYSAKYYSYLWSEVLASDAFAYFKESGDVFHPEISQKFYELLARGGSLPDQENYLLFRDKMQSQEAYLKANGFLK